jgi:NAD(P)-dependent dehydrogenase (short-subunit alcohol dehydrogenase family)
VGAAILEDEPVVHVLVNNAGAIFPGLFADIDVDTWHRTIDVNLSSAFYCTRAFLPGLKAAGDGSIVHHASIDAVFGNPIIPAYSSAKGGLVPMTHVMAHEFAPFGIRTNCILTGGILTGLTGGLSAEYRDQLASKTPLRRMGTAHEVALAILFLASSESSYVNGAALTVDGGRTGLTPGTW